MCAFSHHSFSSHCQGVEAGDHTRFKCQQPLGLPQAHSFHSRQVSLSDTPHLSLHRLFLGVKQSLLKANGVLLGLCFITQTQRCFTPMVVAYLSFLPVGEHQVPHIWVLADDSLFLSMLRESRRNVSLYTGVGTCACQDSSSGSETGLATKRDLTSFLKLKERQTEGKGFPPINFHSIHAASLFIFLFTRSSWRPVKRLHQARPSYSENYALNSTACLSGSLLMTQNKQAFQP